MLSGDHARRSEMAATTNAKRIGVIGAGMVGICAASYLQREGHSVFMVDPGVPGEGASFGNAGAFNASSVTPVAMPGTLKKVPGWLRDPLGPLSLRWSYLPAVLPYLYRFVRAGTEEKIHAQARALRPLVGATLSALQPLVKDAGAENLVHQRGHLYVYRSAESLAKDGMAWALRRENGVVVDEFDTDELRQLEPTLSRDYVRGLLVRENGHTSNPFGLVSALVEHFMRQGGAVIRARALGFRLDGGQLIAIRTDAGELAADGDGKFGATPMDTGLRFAGTVELAGLEAPPDWRRARILLEQGRKMLPGLAAHHPEERLSVWMGHRPSMPDSLPVLGHSRATRDVVYAFGHGHVGMTAAPMTGRLVADLVAGRDPAIDISSFAATRF